MGRKTSIVWNHFTIPVLYPKKALCNYCRQLVCRGQNNLGTTSLMNHLKRCQEFKSTVLGIPNTNDMVSSIGSGGEAQNSLKDQEDKVASEVTCGMPDFSGQADVFDEKEPEQNWQNMPESTSLPLMPSMDDSPSFVGRRVFYPSSQRPIREYQSKDRSSTLLYGDISSTSEPVEEPSSSNTSDGSFMTLPASDLMNYSSSNSCVDFVYGGLVLHMFYQQYKMGKYCDMHIITQKMPTNEVTISETGKILKKNGPFEKQETKISVHASLLAALSRKVNTLVEMGCNTIQLKKGGSDSVRGLMEIVYTGKLEKIRMYSETQLLEILEVARFLEVDNAVQYLMREIPEEKAKPRNNVHRVFQEKLATLSQNIPSPSAGQSSSGTPGSRYKDLITDIISTAKKNLTSLHKEGLEQSEIPALQPIRTSSGSMEAEDTSSPNKKIPKLLQAVQPHSMSPDRTHTVPGQKRAGFFPSRSPPWMKVENESDEISPQDEVLDLKRQKLINPAFDTAHDNGDIDFAVQ